MDEWDDLALSEERATAEGFGAGAAAGAVEGAAEGRQTGCVAACSIRNIFHSSSSPQNRVCPVGVC